MLLLDHILRPSTGWGLPGGFLSAGESPDDAIHREIKEETGIDLDNVRMLKMRVFGRHIEMLFAAETRGTPEVRSGEIKGLGWFTLDDLPDRLPHDHREIIELVLKDEV